MNKRNTLILFVGIVLVTILIGGARRRGEDKTGDQLDLDFTSGDLDVLGDELSGLEYDDLEGLEASGSLNFTSIDLDTLEDALQALSYEDLQGLSEN